MATSNLTCGWGCLFRPATPTSRSNPTRSVHPISTTSADANLYMVTEDHLRGYERIVLAALAQARSPGEKLQALLRATIEAIFTYRKHYLVMLRELHLVGRERRRGFMRLAAEQRQICEDILADINGRDRIEPGQLRLTANILLIMPSLIVSRGWDLRGQVTEAEITEMLMSFLMRGLGFAPVADTEEPAPPA